MSGLATIATVAAIGSAAIGAGSLAYGVVNGQNQQNAQQAALKKQNTAQQTATAGALSTDRQNAVAEGAANQATPNVAGILQRAATAGQGLSSTMLTGPGGVTGGLNLGGTTLLGK
jgi:hypothetical protein